jgi:Family of unknown function (DUF6444)
VLQTASIANHKRQSRSNRNSESWSATFERLSRDNERLRQELIERDKKLAEAERQIADLERKLALRQRNSVTSSKPPSSDGLAGEPRQRGSGRKKSRRKPADSLAIADIGVDWRRQIASMT